MDYHFHHYLHSNCWNCYVVRLAFGGDTHPSKKDVGTGNVDPFRIAIVLGIIFAGIIFSMLSSMFARWVVILKVITLIMRRAYALFFYEYF